VSRITGVIVISSVSVVPFPLVDKLAFSRSWVLKSWTEIGLQLWWALHLEDQSHISAVLLSLRALPEWKGSWSYLNFADLDMIPVYGRSGTEQLKALSSATMDRHGFLGQRRAEAPSRTNTTEALLFAFRNCHFPVTVSH
jgi:hypothetical protein